MAMGLLLSAIAVAFQLIGAHAVSHAHLHVGHPHARQMDGSPQVIDNVFQPMSFDRPPANMPTRDDHPQMPVGVKQDTPLQTNKFYANFFAGDQNNRTWTHPYSVWWPKLNYTQGRGLSISHTDRKDFTYGPEGADPVESFEDTFFRQSLSLSAKELTNDTILTTDSLTAFSVNVNLAPTKGAEALITFPLVQGMGFVTGIYKHATVLLQTGVGFSSVSRIVSDDADLCPGPGASVYGWSVKLRDGSSWLVYLTPIEGVPPPTLLNMNMTLLGPENFSGTVQVAKNPQGEKGLIVFNSAAGAYAETASVSGSVSGNVGKYSLSWTKKGVQSQELLMFALPHHVAAFDDETMGRATDVTLASTTKGIARAIRGEHITMVEPNLPTEIGFDPWSPRFGSVGSASAPGGTISLAAKAKVASVGVQELQGNITTLTNLTSKYYAGVAFSMYARSLYATSIIAGNGSALPTALAKLEAAFDRYVNNQEPNPLVYDGVWKGVVSSGSYGTTFPDASIDFGNTFYNDHNFHYGYYVYTAAIIAHLDPDWLTRNNGANKIWVNTLIRDWANPSTEDPFFPFSRSYDHFHGHSWARGVLEAPDGKDQESSAEDAFSTYAIKMWGHASGDPVMEARGNLQLAITARALQSYYLYDPADKPVQPPQFVGVRAVGILFDRYANHTTYFGDQISFVQGIHMLPINPSSAYTRKAGFVRAEWDQYFANNETNLSGGGFVGHVYVNLAIADVEGAQESYAFMAAQPVNGPLTDGQSLSWNLAYTACLGGALASNNSMH